MVSESLGSLSSLYITSCSIEGRPDCVQLTPSDSFRHCFGSGLMALELGAGFATKLTTMYEAYPENDAEEKAFDLLNNERGVRFAELIGSGPDSERQLQSLCQKE